MSDIVSGGISDKDALSDIDLRNRIATIVHEKDTVQCCDECTISSPGPWDYEVADAIIEALKADYVPVPKGSDNIRNEKTDEYCLRCGRPHSTDECLRGDQ